MDPQVRNVHKLKPYRLQIIILILICIIVIIEPIHFYVMEYLAGLYNDLHLHPFLSGLFFGFLKASLLLVAFIGLVVSLFKEFKIYKRVGIKILLLGLSFGVFIAGWYVHVPGPPGATVFLRGFDKWAQKNVDTTAIQNWLVEIDESYFQQTYDINTGFPDEFPEFIVSLKPKFISFGYSELDGTKIVKLTWGSGVLGQWGVIIGNPGMKMPKLTEEWYSDYGVEFRRILRPGVYIYNRG